jgi:glycine/D-amino acid oxidase-like deaminating enzyme
VSGAAAEVVVCGAGIAGVSAAYHLAVARGISGVVLIDERPPLTLTSDKSTECYRNWWPGPGDAMVRLMERSIDLLDELAAASGNFFALNRSGYAYLTADPAGAAALLAAAEETSALGAGPLRIHRGASDDPAYPEADPDDPATSPSGADLFLDRGEILARFPFVAPDVVALLNPRRAGWLSAQQLGMYLLDRCRERGVRLLRGRVAEVETAAGRVAGVAVAGGGEVDRIAAANLVVAAGPRLAEVAAMLGVDLPVFHELHAKVTFQDRLGVVPRDLPLMIWNDPVTLAWSAEERRDLAADHDLAWLLGPLPGGVHFRPEGGPEGRALLLLWSYDAAPREAVLPPAFDPAYPEVVVRGLARMVPGFAAYFDDLRGAFVDGGYYTKTADNRPLVGPLPVEGSYVLGALSGYGIMASQAAAELLAAHLVGGEPPAYAAAFAPDRFDDPAYRERLAGGDAAAGQL